MVVSRDRSRRQSLEVVESLEPGSPEAAQPKGLLSPRARRHKRRTHDLQQAHDEAAKFELEQLIERPPSATPASMPPRTSSKDNLFRSPPPRIIDARAVGEGGENRKRIKLGFEKNVFSPLSEVCRDDFILATRATQADQPLGSIRPNALPAIRATGAISRNSSFASLPRSLQCGSPFVLDLPEAGDRGSGLHAKSRAGMVDTPPSGPAAFECGGSQRAPTRQSVSTFSNHCPSRLSGSNTTLPTIRPTVGPSPSASLGPAAHGTPSPWGGVSCGGSCASELPPASKSPLFDTHLTRAQVKLDKQVKEEREQQQQQQQMRWAQPGACGGSDANSMYGDEDELSVAAAASAAGRSSVYSGGSLGSQAKQ